MTPNPADRTALFIDGANLYAAAKALNTDLDFRKLVEMYRTRGIWFAPSITPPSSRARNSHPSSRWWTGWTTTASPW